MVESFLGKAQYTSNITKEEAENWFSFVKRTTETHLKDKFPWAYKRYWPLRAAKKNAGNKSPVFIVNHHTSNMKRDYRPAMNRFFSAKMASSNFLVGENENEILYIVDVNDMSYHATYKSWLPLAVRRMLGVSGKWIDCPGIETAGNGVKKFFTHGQFLNVICLQRYLFALYPSLKCLKSHRFFNRVSRAVDPGQFYYLPLVEHAVLNNIDLYDVNYWLEDFKKDPIEFHNKKYKEWIRRLNINPNKDEWWDKRTIATKKNL